MKIYKVNMKRMTVVGEEYNIEKENNLWRRW